LSKYQAQLEALLEGNEAFVQPPARRNEVLGWVREGVRDFSISRSAVSWGIPMRQDPQHTVYVWFDALNGYLSGLLPLSDADSDSVSGSSSLDAVVQQGWPADVHIIGKDILRFHAVYWPGMLMAAGLPLPKQVGVRVCDWLLLHLGSQLCQASTRRLCQGLSRRRASCCVKATDTPC
jgi:methionyl-tRNA synthetase